MHLEKPNDSRYPIIRDIPPDMRVIAFGNYGGANRDSYFAFFAPIDARLRPGMNIDGIRYAEGTLTEEQFSIREDEIVETTRNRDGSYTFKIWQGAGKSWVTFFIQRRGCGESTYNDKPVHVISLRI